MVAKKIIKNGDTFIISKGVIATVTNYINHQNIEIKTSTGWKTITYSTRLLTGTLKDPYFPSVYNIGYIGEGDYNYLSKCYRSWKGMICRCYYQDLPTYKDVTISKEWLNLQVYGRWFDSSNYKKGYELDKDIIKLGNLIYSKDLCIFLPSKINSLFISHKKKSNKYLGVWKQAKNKYCFYDKCFNNIIDCANYYWNHSYLKMQDTLIDYPEFKDILENYFEYWFNKHYPEDL